MLQPLGAPQEHGAYTQVRGADFSAGELELLGFVESRWVDPQAQRKPAGGQHFRDLWGGRIPLCGGAVDFVHIPHFTTYATPVEGVYKG